MSQVTGAVQEVNNRGVGKGSNILVNGTKYGCYDPVAAGISALVAGQVVMFDTVVKGQYTNINGTVTATGATEAVTAPPPKPAYNSGGGGKGGKVFPIPPLDGQRSIVRQNSLTHATAIVNAFAADSGTPLDIDQRYTAVLEVAAKFEAFSCGDDVEKEAAAAVAALGTSQVTSN